ncbi:MAG: AMP-binding protein [Alphaproteobacteria bacterium]|nr:MAG: AMP-binding protein [Alphaproteobacteria bacterium]
MAPKPLSYVSGVSAQPLIYQTISDALTSASETYPDRQAVVSCHEGVSLTYQQLDEQATKLAAGLITLGVKKGDRVGIWSPNNVGWIIVQYATAKIGAILVTINPAYRTSEVLYVLNNVQCSVVILADQFKTSNYIEMMRELAPEIGSQGDGVLSSHNLPHLKHIIAISETKHDGVRRLSDVSELGGANEFQEIERLQAELQPEDVINIQFTSGTTGSPKGASLTHHNILNNGYFVGEGIKLTHEDRICVPVPLYHCFGMVMGNLAAVSHGACVVYPADAFTPDATLAAIAQEKCTALYGVPTMFIAMLESEKFKDTDFSSLRTGIMAGAPCPIETMKKVISDMNMPEVTICYGMTETSPVSFQSAVDDPLEKRVSTLGRVHPHLEVKIVDDDGKVVPRGESGELCTRGYSVMKGYWGDPERTADVLDQQNWMHTGDLAVLDEDGYANIVGRKKDMIIRGGENIYPREIEDFLFTHPEVSEAAVFGVPDATYGEIVVAWIRGVDGKAPNPEEIREYCKGKIAHYKVPAMIQTVDEFPMTVTGKIQKFLMREAVVEQMNLKEIKTA